MTLISPVFPFSAIVGQDELKLALLAAAMDTRVGGVLVFGDRGTGKSTAVRALAALLPSIRVVVGCRYGCDPQQRASWCEECLARLAKARVKTCLVPVPVVDLPLGATEDRVLGALNLEQALSSGVRAFEPGLLAQANRGFLYIDEVNLLIDVAASGVNVVEREGMSVRHPARFVLVGNGNPEEGELRPQLLDRFGLSVEIRTPQDLDQRIAIVRRRDQFERDPQAFLAAWEAQEATLRRQITSACRRVARVEVSDEVLIWAARLCMLVGSDGLRRELTLMRAACAVAALSGKRQVSSVEMIQIAPPALRHRLRRDPMDEAGSGQRIERAIEELGAQLG